MINIGFSLVNQFIDYTSAWDLWKGIETLLSSGRDELQNFDLSIKVASLDQNQDSFEVFYFTVKFQTLLREIDRRMPNLIKYTEDITIHNTNVQNGHFFIFPASTTLLTKSVAIFWLLTHSR